jgi:MYXO-CTERM domain-containing protein
METVPLAACFANAAAGGRRPPCRAGASRPRRVLIYRHGSLGRFAAPPGDGSNGPWSRGSGGASAVTAATRHMGAWRMRKGRFTTLTLVLLVGSLSARRAPADLVVNGGFSVGGAPSLQGWTIASAIPGASSILNAGAFGATSNSAHVAPGYQDAAFFGPSSPTAFYGSPPAPGPYDLSQTFAPQALGTLEGQTVTLSFQLMVDQVADSSEGLTGFQVRWFGTALEPANPARSFGFPVLNTLDYITPSSPGLVAGQYDAVPYTLSFSETVTQSDLDYQGPSLQFLFLNDPGFFYLDGVSVTGPPMEPSPAPEPSTLRAATLAAALAALVAWRRRGRRTTARLTARSA